MTLYSPAFVTETDEPPPWTDCTWSSGLMFANKATATAARLHGMYPATRAEREALRAASGDRTGGSSLYDLRLGIERRYGWTFSLIAISWSSFILRMKRGDGAIVQGLYSALPSHYQRWDRNFAAKGPRSAHAMYFQGHDRAGNQHIDPSTGVLTDLFVCDPLGRGTYRGEWIPASDVRRYSLAIGYCGIATVMQGSRR